MDGHKSISWKLSFRTLCLSLYKPIFHRKRIYISLSKNEILSSLTFTFFMLFLLFDSGAYARDVLPQNEKYLPDYNVYHNLSRIQSHLREIAARNPNFVKIDWSYTSRQNQPQLVVRVTNFTDSHRVRVTDSLPPSKVKILLSFGEHAREFLPIESMFHLLHNLTSGLAQQDSEAGYKFSKNILSNMDIFIVAMMNPDGRRYTENTHNYCWRGTSTGVDLNRNFDWNYGAKGSSGDIKDEEYRGNEPFSEPECWVLVDLTSKFKFDAFLSLHSGVKQIYVPFADSTSKKTRRTPDNILKMLHVAERLSRATVHPYSYGLAYQLNDYTADGTIFDYMAGKRKIPFSFAIELWGNPTSDGSKCFDLFNPVSQQLQATVQEIHPIYVTFFQELLDWKENEIRQLLDPSREAPPLTFGFILLAAVILFFAMVTLHNRLPSCLRLYPRRRIVSLRSLSSTFSMVLNHKGSS